MVIESDGIRVEADTEKEAMKLFRAEQRKAIKERERLKVLEASAESEAKSRGFDVMARLMGEKNIPRGWGLNRERSSVDAERIGCGRFKLTVHDHDHTDFVHSSREIYTYGVDALLENGSGFPMVIWLLDHVGEESSPYAIAAVSEAVGLVPMPQTIRPELFAKQPYSSGEAVPVHANDMPEAVSV